MRMNRAQIVWARRQPRPKHPTIESVHRDIGFANAYRMELLKHLMTISAALFAFTVTFRPTLDAVQCRWAMWIGWTGLAVSMIGGMVHMLGWDHYYKSYRDFDYGLREDPDTERGRREGRAKRNQINRWRRVAMVAQFVGFAIGVIGVGTFAAINIDNVHKQSSAAAPVCGESTPVAPCTSASSVAAPASATAAGGK